MKTCQSCGAPIEEGDKFCTYCGAPISDIPKKNNSTTTNKRMFKAIIAVISIIAVLCIVIPISLTFAKDTKVKSNTNLGNKYLLDGQYEEAILAFEKIISIDSRNIPARIGIVKASAAVKNYDKAFKVLSEVLEIDKDNSEALKMQFDLYSIQAKEAIEAKKYDTAEEAVNKALQLNSKDISFYISIADLYIKQGEINRAIKILETGITNTKDEGLKNKLEELRRNSRGNTPGNIANGGRVVEKDGFIYISYPLESDYGVYKIDKTNRASKIKIANTGYNIEFLNADKEFLYFSSYDVFGQINIDGKATIYRVKLDGTDIKVLTEDADAYSMLTLKNNRLYYINNARNIISMDIEGKNPVKISNDKCETMSVGDEWIYYSNLDNLIKYTFNTGMVGTLDKDMGKIYRVKLDGSGREKFCEDGTESIISDSDYVYYENGGDGSSTMSEGGDFGYVGKLYKINHDGTNKKKVLDYLTDATNVDGNWIYIDDLIRINKSSGEKQTISKSLHAFNINLIDNEILFPCLTIYNVNTSHYDYKYYESEVFGFYGINLN